MAIAPYIRRCCPRLWFFFKFLRYRHWKGENEIHALRRFVPPGRMAIDVGSSIGLYSCALSRIVPEVVAFEANPDVAAFARTVAPRNVEVINVAISAGAGRAVLRIPVNARGHPTNDLATIERDHALDAGRLVSIDVETRRLDDYGFADCGFIKIDVEAHEEAVLDGAERLLQACQPVLMIELIEEQNPGKIGRVTARLSRLGYDAYFLSRSELRPMSEFRVEEHQNVKAYMALPRWQHRNAEYINNFIFIPRKVRPPGMARS